MRSFDAAIFMADSEVISGRVHAVMVADRRVQLGQLWVATAYVSIGGAQTIGAMGLRGSATGMERILQPLR